MCSNYITNYANLCDIFNCSCNSCSNKNSSFKSTLAASIGLKTVSADPSQSVNPILIYQWTKGGSTPNPTPIPPPVSMAPFVIPFNNVYVNQKEKGQTPFDVNKKSYTILSKGIYKIAVNLNFFMLSLKQHDPANPVVLTNLGRYRVSVMKRTKTGSDVLLASEESYFNRDRQIPAEAPIPPASVSGINDNDDVDLQFMVSTNKNNDHHVEVGDLIYVTVQLTQGPVGNIDEYRFSVLVAPRPFTTPQISGSFLNIHRISQDE